jgi:hypothetical protein
MARRWGIVGVAALSTFGSLLFAALLMLSFIKRFLPLHKKEMLLMLQPLKPCALAAASIFAIKPFFGEDPVSFIILTTSFVLLFLLYLYLLQKPLLLQAISIVRRKNFLKDKNFAKV